MNADALKSLAGTLLKLGAPAVGTALGGPAGGAIASAVIGALAEALGVEPTPEAVQTKMDADPQAAQAAARSVEASQGPTVAMVHAATAQALAAAEVAREAWFSWAWRPAMSWLLIVLWTWALLILPTLKATALSALQPIPMDNLLSFTGIWLTIYGGGHTLKSIFGKA